MKSKLMIVSTVALMSVAAFSLASAESRGSEDVRANIGASVQTNNVEVDAESQGDVRGNEDGGQGDAANSKDGQETRDGAASSTAQNDREDHRNASSTDESKGELTADSHRSAVSAFVESLLNVADREDGIGEEVRAVAQTQNDSASTTADAIAHVDERNALQTFLFGSDYKHLATLRSELNVTNDNIQKLQDIRDKATKESDKTELSNQIKVLQDSQAQIDAFVQIHENAFSLFGWLTKLFAR